MRPASLAASALLALVALAHLARFLLQVEVTAGGHVIPMWMSLAAFVFTGCLAILLQRERRR